MQVLTNCTIYTGEEILTCHAVVIDKGLIKDIISEEDIPKDALSIDLQGHDLTAGFVDLQLYGGQTGFFGRDLSFDSLDEMIQTHRQDGTVALVPTLYSSSHSRILKAIEVTKSYIQSGKKGF
ncbi:MAG: hypothetical protein R2822_24490 [Spirosomataceae bacterium]